jgi:hypothetical protein
MKPAIAGLLADNRPATIPDRFHDARAVTGKVTNGAVYLGKGYSDWHHEETF